MWRIIEEMCFQWIKKLICGEPESKIKPPKTLDPIDASEILTILRAELGESCRIYLSDFNYKTTTKSELRRFLNSDETDLYTYQSEYFDCDNFSYRLMGNLSIPNWAALPFGILWVGLPNGGGHALNIFIDKNREVWIVEPQNDRVYKFPENWTPWLVMM